MRPLTQREIRASFVDCTKGEASRMHIPHDRDSRSWEELDHFGWRDPQSPARGHLFADLDGLLQGVVLRAPQSAVGSSRKSMCSLSIRGQRPVDGPGIPETLSAEDRAARLLTRLEEFLGRVCDPR